MPVRELFFVSCSRGVKETTELYRSLQKLQIADYHFFEHNRRGLSECYNEYLDRFAGTDWIVVLVHSDVTVADVFVREKLNDALATFDVVGLAGSAYFDIGAQTTTYAWPVWPAQYLSGAVEHPTGNGQAAWFNLGPTPRRCVVLDGLFLAVNMRSVGSVRFDPRFRFHFYDLDFCLTAHRHSLALGTTNVYAQHASAGNFGTQEYEAAMREFRAKWRDANAARGGTRESLRISL
jgi:hypothetical protein